LTNLDRTYNIAPILEQKGIIKTFWRKNEVKKNPFRGVGFFFPFGDFLRLGYYRK
jgi:hypothetical protein